MNTELTVRQLRWILANATDEATLPEALSELADAERLDAEAVEHGALLTAFNAYIARRRERETEQVQRSAADNCALLCRLHHEDIEHKRLDPATSISAVLPRIRSS